MATHPLLLDELLDPRVFEQAPSRSELAADLEVRLSRVAADDAEARLDALRNFQQAAIFRVAVVDLTGVLPLMKVSDRLTDIAELVLEAALALAWQELVARHGEPRCVADGAARPARFAIVAYGKLGGLELGYGSDLDLVFLNDSEGEQQQTDGAQPLDNAVFFSRLTRRIISILTMHTTSGKLYEVDIRLRPSGQSGLLVSSLTAFDLYQRQDAWTWEHQALLRSRAVAGDAGVKAAFEQLRVKALTTYVRRENLAKEVADMRQRMRDELSKGTPELLDVKQDPGRHHRHRVPRAVPRAAGGLALPGPGPLVRQHPAAGGAGRPRHPRARRRGGAGRGLPHLPPAHAPPEPGRRAGPGAPGRGGGAGGHRGPALAGGVLY